MGLPNEHSVNKVGGDDAWPAAHTLREQIKIHVGSSCTVDVVEPGTLERSNGKLRRIYDLRPKA
jgi:phenylacetate-CoA ligase